MKFQKKIVVMYTTFAILVTFVIGGLYYGLSARGYKDEAYSRLRALSDMEMQQFNSMAERMESVSNYLLSDKAVLEALKTLSVVSSTDPRAPGYYNDATDVIRLRLNVDYIMNNFYRVVVFNDKGDVIASNNYSVLVINPAVTGKDLPWLHQVRGRQGKAVILGRHRDDWGQRRRPDVVSMVKEIQGLDMGYIEVQQDVSALARFLRPEDDGVEILFLKGDGSVVYGSGDSGDAAYYFARRPEDGRIREIRGPDGEKILLACRRSPRWDVTLLALNRVDISRNAMMQVLPMTILLLAGFILLSFGYVFLTSRYLAKPIRQLQRFMEATKLDNMQAEIGEKISNDEINALYGSYKAVLRRLEEYIVKEKRMSLLQLQAQFDLLQAQVNPHFIYNVLNVISSRGILSDDEVICDICGDLAAMLRYSTNTREKYATVREEAEYLTQYLRLLKYRYEHKLTYEIAVDGAVAEKRLPKIVLQQIVENSVVHGYENSNAVIELCVTGWRDHTGWYLRVHDGGGGIPPERLTEIRGRFDEARRKLTEERQNVELEIGGMGLVNTYARLYLLLGDALIFRIESPGQGTDVIIGALDGREEPACIV